MQLNGVWMLLLKVALTSYLPAMGWLFLDVNTIKASRFTSDDGREVWREFSSIREVMAALPPDSWEERLDNRLRETEKRLNALTLEVRELRVELRNRGDD